MGGHGDVGAVVVRQDVIENLPRPRILSLLSFGVQWLPVEIMFWEAFFESVAWEIGADVGFCAATIACVPADTLAKLFLDGWDKWVLSWQLQPRECELGRRETSV